MIILFWGLVLHLILRLLLSVTFSQSFWGKMTSSHLYNGKKKSYSFCPFFTHKGTRVRFPDVLHYLFFFFFSVVLPNSILCIWYLKFSRCRLHKKSHAWLGRSWLVACGHLWFPNQQMIENHWFSSPVWPSPHIKRGCILGLVWCDTGKVSVCAALESVEGLNRDSTGTGTGTTLFPKI